MKLGIIGDSISTYSGWIPSGYSVYYPQGDVNSVDKTWWYKVAVALGLDPSTQVSNCSWSGSKVTGDAASTSSAACGCSTKRITDLANFKFGGNAPDVVICYISCNDWGSEVPLGDWVLADGKPTESTVSQASRGYALMLYKLKETYPHAMIFCCTNLDDVKRDETPGAPSDNGNGVTVEQWNTKIKYIANVLGCHVIDLHECGVNYSNIATTYNIDGLHPNAAGHQVMADFIINQIKNNNMGIKVLLNTSYPVSHSDAIKVRGENKTLTEKLRVLDNKDKTFTKELEGLVKGVSDDSEADLNIGDSIGNVILQLIYGHIKTKNFDSSSIDISNLSTALQSLIMSKNVELCEDDSDADFNIGDKYGNVIFSIKDGQIQTKNFDTQNGTNNPYKYYGQKVEIAEHSFDISTYMNMVNPTGKGNQGMDIWGGVLFSAKDTGYVCLYDFANKQTNPFATIKLQSNGNENHCNVLNLAAQQADGSPYPLMYVSVGNVGASIEYYCHVEKIVESGGVYSSLLVQTIRLDATGFSAAGFQKIFGSPLWLLDKIRNKLWAFSAIRRTTVEETGDMRTNKYVATCFDVPDISMANVTLTAADIVKQSVFEFDAYITQGGCIYDGIIYYTFGYGEATGDTTAKIRVFNTDNNSILSRINLAGIMNYEPEDCCIYNGKLYMQIGGTQSKPLYVFKF